MRNKRVSYVIQKHIHKVIACDFNKNLSLLILYFCNIGVQLKLGKVDLSDELTFPREFTTK